MEVYENLDSHFLEDHAVVLSTQLYKESDKIVHLYTANYGKLSFLAKNAARSLKRFGAALEVFSHVKAHFKKGSHGAADSRIKFLEKVDLQDSFLHLRSRFESLESSFFVCKFVLDLLPEGSPDKLLFQALGRFFRDSIELDFSIHASWARCAFLSWYARHAGFGSIDSFLWDDRESFRGELKLAWQKSLSSGAPNFKDLFKVLSLSQETAPTLSDEVRLYQNWIASSGLHWEHFEKWLNSKQSAR